MEYKQEYYDKVNQLANYIITAMEPKMKWMWGEALLGYALDELDNTNELTSGLNPI